jgi:hypothetical protein
LRLSGENITIEHRFRGPIGSGNGGYTCGRLAAFLDGPAEVTLRLPPPLDRPLEVAERGGVVVLLDGDEVVAEAVPAAVDIEPPVRPTLAEAEAAASRHVRMADERFNECFTCGVREEGDGLCIYAGPLEDGVVHAAPWTPKDVAPELVWAAIDCPGAFAVGGPGRGEVVLGRMAAELRRLPAEGERCVVVAWPLGEDGRKLHAGTALLGEDGALLARARQIWIQPRIG